MKTRIRINKHKDNKNYNNNSGSNNNGNKNKSPFAGINTKIILDSLVKLNPHYLAKNNPVMFTVKLGFIVVLAIGLFLGNGISSEFVTQNRIFYLESAIILILTVWFATFSESLSEDQARARVDSLRSLEKEVSVHKIVNHDREVLPTMQPNTLRFFLLCLWKAIPNYIC